MKFEMYEKVGEVVVAELRSASTNNAIATAEAARIAEAERAEREAKEAQEKAAAAVVLAHIVEAINHSAEKGRCSVRFEWTQSFPKSNGLTDMDWLLYSKYFQPVLEAAGYTIDIPHWYSQSWVTRSGKIGYVAIRW